MCMHIHFGRKTKITKNLVSMNMLWLCITSDNLVEKALKAFADSCCRLTLKKIRSQMWE